MDVERLRLADESSAVGGHVDNALLTDFPNRLVNRLEFCWNSRNVLDRTLMSNNELLHVFIPQSHLNEISQQPRIDNLEFASQDSSSIDVRSVRLEALIVAQDLTGTGSRHRCNQKTVSETSSDDLLLQAVPFPKIRRCNTPEIELQFAFTCRTAFEGRVRTFSNSEFV